MVKLEIRDWTLIAFRIWQNWTLTFTLHKYSRNKGREFIPTCTFSRSVVTFQLQIFLSIVFLLFQRLYRILMHRIRRFAFTRGPRSVRVIVKKNKICYLSSNPRPSSLRFILALMQWERAWIHLFSPYNTAGRGVFCLVKCSQSSVTPLENWQWVVFLPFLCNWVNTRNILILVWVKGYVIFCLELVLGMHIMWPKYDDQTRSGRPKPVSTKVVL